MKHSALLLSAALIASSVDATASITLSFAGGTLGDSFGNAMNDGGLLLLVASSTDTLFNGPAPTFSLTAGSSFGGDDIILASFTIDSASSGMAGGYASALSGFNYTGNLGSGDLLQLYWFPTLTLSSTSVGENTSYGAYRTESISSNSDIAWALPSDGASMALNFVTVTNGGDISDSLGRATLTTVPEPATTVALLGGIAGVFVMLRRRQQHRTAAAAAS